jgi:hypothetical protein
MAFNMILAMSLPDGTGDRWMTVGLWDVLVTAGLACLLLLAVAHNIGIEWRLLRKLEGMAIVPKWTFFAPTPGTFNFYLLYRDRDSGGGVTPWQVLHGMDRERGRWTFIWNPNRRLRKALHDLITSLPFDLYKTHPHLFKLSMPYLVIISHVAALPRMPSTSETQFMIMKKYLDEPAELVFCSELHRL